MRRREVLTLLGGAAVLGPRGAWGQQAMPVVGYLDGLDPNASAHLVAAFREGLTNAGYVEGKNVSIEYQWAKGQYDRLPVLAADLVARRVTVVAAMTTASALAAKGATSTVPIVFNLGSDPVKLGIVESLNRPGGNATGIVSTIALLGSKRLDLLRHFVAADALIAFLANPTNPNTENETGDVRTAAESLGRRILMLKASSEREIDKAFKTLVQQGAAALIVSTDPFYTTRRHQIVALANHYGVPAIYYLRDYVAAGGLLSYGPNFIEAYRQAGDYTARILKGASPAELPVIQAAKFELSINLKTAKGYSLAIPTTLLALADEVIE